MSLDSFKCRKTLKVGTKTYTYFSLKAAEKNGLAGISRLPFSMKVLLENLLRFEDGRSVTKKDIEAFLSAFVYNAYGATSMNSVAKLVFTNENYIAKQLSRKTRPNPPPDEVNAEIR